MTNAEAKKILEAYIACESKKAHFECSDGNCDDDCPLFYEMGTVGEFNEAINIAIQALEQQSSVSENPNNCDFTAETGYISIDDVMSVFDDFMCGEVDEDGTDTFLEMLKDKRQKARDKWAV